MIVNCTPDVVNDLIDNMRRKNIAYLKISKVKDDIVADYLLLEDIKGNDSIVDTITDSINYVVESMNQLKTLKKALSNNVNIPSYSLTFDATQGKVFYSHSISFPKGAFDKNIEKEPATIEWSLLDTMFDSDEEVPGVYTKKSSKKYQQITYRELKDILKEKAKEL